MFKVHWGGELGIHAFLRHRIRTFEAKDCMGWERFAGAVYQASLRAASRLQIVVYDSFSEQNPPARIKTGITGVECGQSGNQFTHEEGSGSTLDAISWRLGP